MPSLDRDVVERLRAALDAADYRVGAVAELLGPQAHAALGRHETVPGELATRDLGPLSTLVRLWVLQLPVPTANAEAALPDLVDVLCSAGLLTRSVGEVAARVDLRPYAVDDDAVRDLWVASDLTPGLDGSRGRVGANHVLGISPAATSLAELTVRTPVGRALDLGTGCGVQSLHLARHARSVTATDVNPRALWFTELNAALNGLTIEVREGSFFEPVGDERYDLVVSNPPFVISPGTGERLVYRDSGLPGDQVVEHLVRSVPDHLAPGGTCQLLADWMVLRDEPWQQRLAGWLDGVDAWVVQRELTDLPTYVELWLKDAGAHPQTGGDPAEYRRRYDTWLSWLEAQGAEAIGFGWINLRHTDAEPQVACVDWPYEVALPLGPEVDRTLSTVRDLATTSDHDLMGSRLLRPADVVQETVGAPGAEDPTAIVLRRQTGLRPARQVSTAEAAFVGACDGELTAAQLDAALEDLGHLTVPAQTLRELVSEGFLALRP